MMQLRWGMKGMLSSFGGWSRVWSSPAGNWVYESGAREVWAVECIWESKIQRWNLKLWDWVGPSMW